MVSVKVEATMRHKAIAYGDENNQLCNSTVTRKTYVALKGLRLKKLIHPFIHSFSQFLDCGVVEET